MRTSIFTRALIVCISLIAVGCGGDKGVRQYAISGIVKFEGVPIKEGRITFRKADGSAGQSFSAPITDGDYDLKAEPGAMIVEITASRLIPGKFDKSNGTPEPVGEMYIPKKYNSATTLKAEVEAKSNTIPFVLTK